MVRYHVLARVLSCSRFQFVYPFDFVKKNHQLSGNPTPPPSPPDGNRESMAIETNMNDPDKNGLGRHPCPEPLIIGQLSTFQKMGPIGDTSTY